MPAVIKNATRYRLQDYLIIRSASVIRKAQISPRVWKFLRSTWGKQWKAEEARVYVSYIVLSTHFLIIITRRMWQEAHWEQAGGDVTSLQL